jgi:flagellar biosynthetic protein FliR
MPLVGDVAAHTTATIALAFKIGIQLSAPFIVFGLLFNLGLGVLSRLMPQMQVFFIGLPASIIGGFLILLLVIGSMMGCLPRRARGHAAPARTLFVRSHILRVYG